MNKGRGFHVFDQQVDAQLWVNLAEQVYLVGQNFPQAKISA